MNEKVRASLDRSLVSHQRSVEAAQRWLGWCTAARDYYAEWLRTGQIPDEFPTWKG